MAAQMKIAKRRPRLRKSRAPLLLPAYQLRSPGHYRSTDGR